jgi:hypothetical protein
VSGWTGFGPDEAVRVAVSDDLQVDVVGDAAADQHVYSCCRDSSAVARPCMVSAVIPCAMRTVVA